MFKNGFFSNTKINIEYYSFDDRLEDINIDCDLGIVFWSNLLFPSHIDPTCSNAQSFF